LKPLSVTGTKWLKIVHLLLAALWVGGAFALVLMQYGLAAGDRGMLHGIDTSMKFVDDFVVIPAAIGTALTGLIYALKTQWGFFRHRWVTVKWIITVAGLVVGTLWLGPWLNAMPPISAALGLDALSDPAYVWFKRQNGWVGVVQVAALVFALGLSVLKPWERRA
jgi:putative copper export protein